MTRVFTYQHQNRNNTENPESWRFCRYGQAHWTSTPVLIQNNESLDLTFMWTTGRAAHDAMTQHKAIFSERDLESISFRVFPLESVDWHVYETGQSVDEYLEGAASWKAREQARFDSGDYMRLPWAGQAWFDVPHESLAHFAHVSKQNPRRVTFTDGEQNGIADRQASPMNPGRYFTRFATEYNLTAERIRELSVEYSAIHGASDDFELCFASTPDEIVGAYNYGSPGDYGQYSPTSCMSHGASHFGGQHPAQVYGAGDLQCAYLLDRRRDEPRLTARAIVWPEKLIYSRIYGDEERLADRLQALGYKSSSDFDGARLLAIPHNRGNGDYVMPYLDFYGQSVDMCHDENGKEYFRVNRNGDLQCGSTNGRLYYNYCTCENCGDDVDADDTYSIDGDGQYCESCYRDLTTACDCCGNRFHSESDSLTEVADSVHWCENCESSYFYDGHSERAVRVSMRSEMTIEDGNGFEHHISTRYAGLYFTCCETGVTSLREDELVGWIGRGDGMPVSRDGLAMMQENESDALADYESLQAREERESRQLEFDLALRDALNPPGINWTPETPVPNMSDDFAAAIDAAERLARDETSGLDHDSRVLMLRNVADYRARVTAYLQLRERARETLAKYRAAGIQTINTGALEGAPATESATV